MRERDFEFCPLYRIIHHWDSVEYSPSRDLLSKPVALVAKVTERKGGRNIITISRLVTDQRKRTNSGIIPIFEHDQKIHIEVV